MTFPSATAVFAEAAEGEVIRLSDLPGSHTAARQAATRAVKAGLAVRAKPGVYIRVAQTEFGVVSPSPHDVAKAVFGSEGVGPACFSAAREWGVTTQIPTHLHIATLWPVAPIRGIVQHARKNRARLELNWREIALIELLRSPELYLESSWRTLAEKVERAVRGGEVSLPKIEHVALHERKPQLLRSLTRLRDEHDES